MALAGIAAVLWSGCGSDDATTAETGSEPDPAVAGELEPDSPGAPAKPPAEDEGDRTGGKKAHGDEAVTGGQGGKSKKGKEKKAQLEPDSAASDAARGGAKSPRPSPSAAEQAAHGTGQGGASGPSAAELAK
ncbi:MAG TPA: hypothetical protein VHH72_01855 [Solirubrobacterales bacterium]|nr:hypothetical protein [Solirubrobacterales bacterium]